MVLEAALAPAMALLGGCGGGFALGRLSGGGKGSKAKKTAKAGDRIPQVNLDKGFPPEKFPLREFCQGKKVVLVGLPGAFTPT
mmetsp:Transcript_137033/g.273317  ORF Transcript_137033/g.273317 Transcript_137033/m.273317 type:complete len:83 (+) Transcript_137033:74-322(+)